MGPMSHHWEVGKPYSSSAQSERLSHWVMLIVAFCFMPSLGQVTIVVVTHLYVADASLL